MISPRQPDPSTSETQFFHDSALSTHTNTQVLRARKQKKDMKNCNKCFSLSCGLLCRCPHCLTPLKSRFVVGFRREREKKSIACSCHFPLFTSASASAASAASAASTAAESPSVRWTHNLFMHGQAHLSSHFLRDLPANCFPFMHGHETGKKRL